MDVSLCFISLVMSSVYVLIFVTTSIYLIVINRCKFNKRTKIVISILSVQMSLAMGSSVLTYVNEQEMGTCSIYPLAYSLQAYQHVIILIIYSFLVARMLSIYSKMQLAVQARPNWKARWARRLSNYKCQRAIISIYFLVYSGVLWTFHIL